jgi:ATP-independent RNA helicase DbpA
VTDSSATNPDFTSLHLSAAMLSNLVDLGYTSMTPIQAESLPHLLAGKDVIAQAKTGSGKTAAFGIALLSRLNPRLFVNNGLAVQAMVLCPTRELADQVAKELRRLARCIENVKVLTLCGGVAIEPQVTSLEHGAHVVVGTPGRVLKLMSQGTLVLKHLNTLVLDEADRMLDMGFHDSMVEVARRSPARRQTLLFSATYPDAIRGISQKFQREPVDVRVESVHADAQIEQLFFEVPARGREQAVAALLAHYQPSSAVLFCNTKLLCDEVTRSLRAQGFHALALHGDLEQRERDQVLVQFSNHSCPVLVATDVAARGLDIKELAAVINVDMAFDPEMHIHRIGRTGRAGQSGLALSVCTPSDASRIGAIEDYYKTNQQKQKLVWKDLPPMDGRKKPPLPRMVTLNISGGRRDKLRAGDILGALTGTAGFEGKQIGKIDIFNTQAFVAVEYDLATSALERLQACKIKGRAFRVRLLKC